jgi:dipeptidyl aminopeptidase/acylaminoacyl peptidase
VAAKSATPAKPKLEATANPHSSAEIPLVLTNSTPPEMAISGVFTHGFGGNVSYAGWEKASDSASAPRINQLFIVDIVAKTTKQLTKDEGGYFNPAWAPDGKVIISSTTEGVEHPMFDSPTSAVVAIDAATGTKRDLVTTPGGDKCLPVFSPDGTKIAYLAGGYTGRQVLYVVPAQGGTPVQVGKNLDRYIYAVRWLPDSKSVVIYVKDGLSEPILSVAVDTGEVRQLSGPAESARAFLTVSRTGDLAWQQSDGSNDNVVYFRSAQTASTYALLDLNPQTKSWLLGEQKAIHWRNSRGDDMEGTLILPPGYEAGKKYPLILDCYPGMSNSFRAMPYGGNFAWAARGYVIFNPDARAPHVWMNPSKGKDYDLAAKGPDGWDVTYDDIMTGVEDLIRQGIVDENRMGLFGFSNGGGVADYMVTKTNRFKCAVTDAGVYPDWFRPILLEGYDSVVSFSGGVSPWDDPGGYIKLSAVFHLDKVNTPMLLADGDNDGDFLLGMIEMYNSLRILHKEVTFVRYPGQAHVLTGWALKDFWDRTAEFFDKHLKPESPATSVSGS